MNKNVPADLLKSWTSNSGRPNVLIAAPEDAPYLTPLLAMRDGERPYEVIQVDSSADAMPLLVRGRFAVVVMDARPWTAGFLEMLVTGLAKSTPPQFVFVCDGGDASLDTQGGIRLVSRDLPGFRVCEQVIRGVQDFEKARKEVLPVDLLRAVCRFPDDYWLRIKERSGATADLCVNAGRVVYCEAGKSSGEAAARLVLSWGPCEFEYRESPAFLRGNMDRELAQMLHSGWQEAPAETAPADAGNSEIKAAPAKPSAWQMPPASNSDQPRTTTESEIEEPLDIPILVGVTLDPLPAATQPEAVVQDWADEPQEPVFDPAVPEPDIFVEEPPEMFLEMETAGGFDEPSLPEFSAMEQPVSAQQDLLRSEVFACFAVLNTTNWQMEKSYPEGSGFSASLLQEFFSTAGDCATKHNLGPVKRTLLIGEHSTLVVALAHGSGRLLVARTRDRFFGELEEAELMKLLEAVAVTAPVVSA